MFKDFFICPHCGRPLYSKEGLLDAIKDGTVYCTQCGEKIASALMEALAEMKKEKAAD